MRPKRNISIASIRLVSRHTRNDDLHSSSTHIAALQPLSMPRHGHAVYALALHADDIAQFRHLRRDATLGCSSCRMRGQKRINRCNVGWLGQVVVEPCLACLVLVVISAPAGQRH